ncbi:MAG: acyltransferase [Novosphingobium sp.]|nr:acyltransferase [Novosphingobium sp.]
MSFPEPRTARLDALSGLRGIAAWLVVLYHVRLSLTEIVPAEILAVLGKGYLAVDVFFVLSGFVIWLNYADSVATGGWSAIGRYLWRRLARVWPLHAIVLAAFVALALLLHATGRDASAYPFSELPLHLLMVQNWGFTSALTWNDPAWSISTEFAAYLAFPLLALTAARLPRVSPTAMLAIAGLLGALIWALFAANGHATLGADIPRLGLGRCLAEFALGCTACALWRRGAGTAAGWFGCAFGWIAGGGVLGWPETAIAPLAIFASILALSFGHGALARRLGSGVVRWLGEVSYSTYLSHVLLFTLFKLAFVGADLQLGWGGLAGYLALVLAASAALYRWVERPAQRALNRLVPARSGAAPQPSA